MRKNFQSMSNISLNVNKSSDDMLIKPEEKNSITGTSTISKKTGKKFSYFASKLNSNSQNQAPNAAKDDHRQDESDNKSLRTHNSSKHNGNAHTLENGNFYNSISTTSISDMRNLYQKKQSQLNQKFQTLRRSFNTKTSLTKMQTTDAAITTSTTTPAPSVAKVVASSSTTLATPTNTTMQSPLNNVSPTASLTKSLKKNSGKKSSSKNDDVLFDLLNSEYFKKQQQQQHSLSIKESNCSNAKKEIFSPESPNFLNTYISTGMFFITFV